MSSDDRDTGEVEPVKSGNGNGDAVEDAIHRIARESVQSGYGARIANIETELSGFRTVSGVRYDTLRDDIGEHSKAIIGLQVDLALDRKLATRRHDHLMQAHETILSRLDKSETDDAARDRAAASVHRHAAKARADVLALGTSVATVRERADSISSEVAAVDRKAERARILAIVRIPALMAAGAALWKLFQVLYPFIH